MKLDPSEHSIQSTLVGILAYKMRPKLVRLSIPNGGMRHPAVGAMLKREGLVPGSPDLVFAMEQGATLWLEMKKLKGKVSDAQMGIHHKLRELGHKIEVAHSVDQALDILAANGILK